MSNDLELFQDGGEVAPISPAPVPDLFERTAEDSWQDHLPVPADDYHPAAPHTGQGFQLFGNPIPQDTPEPQIKEALSALSATYYSDMIKLGHKPDWCHAAVKWFQNNARKAPVQEQIRHRYNLHNMQNDLVANSFANAMAQVGASQEAVSNSLWWLQEVERRLIAARNDPNNAEAMAMPGMAPSSDPTDQLTDAQFEVVLQRNELAKAATLDYLRNRWGDSFYAELNAVEEYFASLPVHEQAHLNSYTDEFIAGTNTPQIMVFLHNQMIGAGSIPQTGPGIAQEIASWQHVMKTEPARWRADLRGNARYRQLLRIRDGH